MSDSAGWSETPSPHQGEADEQHEEHLEALGKSAEDLPDMTDPKQWRDAPKEGGGA